MSGLSLYTKGRLVCAMVALTLGLFALPALAAGGVEPCPMCPPDDADNRDRVHYVGVEGVPPQYLGLPLPSIKEYAIIALIRGVGTENAYIEKFRLGNNPAVYKNGDPALLSDLSFDDAVAYADTYYEWDPLALKWEGHINTLRTYTLPTPETVSLTVYGSDKGWVAQVDAANRTITLRHETKDTVQYSVYAEAEITVRKEAATLAQVPPGDKVEVRYVTVTSRVPVKNVDSYGHFYYTWEYPTTREVLKIRTEKPY